MGSRRRKETPGTPVHPRPHSRHMRRRPLPPTQTPTRHRLLALHNLAAAPRPGPPPPPLAARPGELRVKRPGSSEAEPYGAGPGDPDAQHTVPLGREHPLPVRSRTATVPPPHPQARGCRCHPRGHPPASTSTPRAPKPPKGGGKPVPRPRPRRPR